MTTKQARALSWTAGSDLPRLVAWACLAILVLCLCLARTSQIHLDDDNLFLAYAAQSEGARAAELEESLISRIAAARHCEESVHRLRLRQRYSHNYAGYAEVQGALQRATALFVPAGPVRIIAATLAVKVLFLLALSGALAVVALRSSSRELEMAVLGAFIVLVALDIATRWFPAVVRLEINKPAHATWELVSSFFVISTAHSYFGLTPRNAALLLFVIALLFKWQGRWAAALLALLVVAPIHQTYGGLGLALFAVTSAVSRPELFSTRVSRLLLVSVGLIYLARENLFEHFRLWAQIACAVGLVAMALLTFRVLGSAAFAAFRRRCLGRWLDREISLDAAVLVALAVLFMLVGLIGDGLTNDPIARRYVWANLPIRTLSFVRFPAFIAGILFVSRHIQWHGSPRGGLRFAATCALSCLALSYLLLAQVDVGAWKRLGREMRGHLGAPRNEHKLEPRAEEDRIYAHLTMVAAGQMEASAADASIVRDRPIKCPRRGKRR